MAHYLPLMLSPLCLVGMVAARYLTRFALAAQSLEPGREARFVGAVPKWVSWLYLLSLGGFIALGIWSFNSIGWWGLVVIVVVFVVTQAVSPLAQTLGAAAGLMSIAKRSN